MSRICEWAKSAIELEISAQEKKKVKERASQGHSGTSDNSSQLVDSWGKSIGCGRENSSPNPNQASNGSLKKPQVCYERVRMPTTGRILEREKRLG